VWNLTQGRVHATDPSNASRTLLFDIHRGEWDDDFCALLDVPRAVLPSIVSSPGVRRDPAGGVSIPIAGIAGDQQAALFGRMPRAGSCEEYLRHRLLPVDEHRTVRSPVEPAHDDRVAARRLTDTRSKGRCSSAGGRARLRDGLKTIRANRSPRSRRALLTTAASTSCLRSQGSALLTGMHTRAVRCSGSRAA
jgi:hypothetical protein